MAAYLSQRNVLEDNINLENLRKLKSAFQVRGAGPPPAPRPHAAPPQGPGRDGD